MTTTPATADNTTDAPHVAAGQLLEHALRAAGETDNGRVELDSDDVGRGLARLAMILIKLLHELLERQAVARMQADTLSDEELDRLGEALSRQAQAIDELRERFGLTHEDLNVDLGPLGRVV